MTHSRAIWICLAVTVKLGCSMVPHQATPPSDKISKSCKHNTESLLGVVTETYYPEFQKKGASAVKAQLARRSLENARHVMYPKSGQGMKGGATCVPGDETTPEFADLETKLADTEKLVVEMETAKGVKFARVEHMNHIVYVDEDGNPVSNSSNY